MRTKPIFRALESLEILKSYLYAAVLLAGVLSRGFGATAGRQCGWRNISWYSVVMEDQVWSLWHTSLETKAQTVTFFYFSHLPQMSQDIKISKIDHIWQIRLQKEAKNTQTGRNWHKTDTSSPNSVLSCSWQHYSYTSLIPRWKHRNRRYTCWYCVFTRTSRVNSPWRWASLLAVEPPHGFGLCLGFRRVLWSRTLPGSSPQARCASIIDRRNSVSVCAGGARSGRLLLKINPGLMILTQAGCAFLAYKEDSSPPDRGHVISGGTLKSPECISF